MATRQNKAFLRSKQRIARINQCRLYLAAHSTAWRASPNFSCNQQRSIRRSDFKCPRHLPTPEPETLQIQPLCFAIVSRIVSKCCCGTALVCGCEAPFTSRKICLAKVDASHKIIPSNTPSGDSNDLINTSLKLENLVWLVY